MIQIAWKMRFSENDFESTPSVYPIKFTAFRGELQ
jgi:hypothetical protein